MLKYIYDLYVQLQNINRYLDPGRILHILNYEFAIICVYIYICIYMKYLPTHVTGNLNLEITQLIILFPKKCKTTTWNIQSYLLICSFQIPRLCFPAVTKSFNSSFFMEGPCEITWHTWHILHFQPQTDCKVNGSFLVPVKGAITSNASPKIKWLQGG